ncbi:pyrroloquinoline quinone biosynthesis peptide chaperone PqqD [Saccharomonospora sp. NPDC046836]|uniref:pyrroloquinoline quinone biosynthesis peptide chaperone PqqD n=1 Tax=Saccharomonospora sp. NPDC046836 TaxID=3156921 RepID=UPI003401EB1D
MRSTELIRTEGRPRLSRHVRLMFDRVRERHVLLAPESVTVLNATAAAILAACDGRRTAAEIVEDLRGRYDQVADDQVRDFLLRLTERGYVEIGDD